jgi:hypothetical protein
MVHTTHKTEVLSSSVELIPGEAWEYGILGANEA